MLRTLMLVIVVVGASAIVVEEWKAAVDTEGGDPTIYSLADREPLGSKLAIIYRTLDRVPPTEHRVDSEV